MHLAWVVTAPVSSSKIYLARTLRVGSAPRLTLSEAHGRWFRVGVLTSKIYGAWSSAIGKRETVVRRPMRELVQASLAVSGSSLAEMNEVSQLLQAADRGDRKVVEELLPAVCEELRQLDEIGHPATKLEPPGTSG